MIRYILFATLLSFFISPVFLSNSSAESTKRVELVNKTINLHKEAALKMEKRDEALPAQGPPLQAKPSGATSTLLMSNTKLKVVEELCMYGFMSIILHKIQFP